MYSATVGYSELSNEETQGHPDSGPFYNQPGGGGVTKSYPTLEIYLLKKKKSMPMPWKQADRNLKYFYIKRDWRCNNQVTWKHLGKKKLWNILGHNWGKWNTDYIVDTTDFFKCDIGIRVM